MAEGAIITAIKTKDGNTHQLGVTQANVTGLVSALAAKLDVLTAGTNITIANNVISASGGSGEPSTYIKDASVSNEKLTLTKKDGTTTVELDVSGKANLSGATFTGDVTMGNSVNESKLTVYGPIDINSTDNTIFAGNNGITISGSSGVYLNSDATIYSNADIMPTNGSQSDLGATSLPWINVYATKFIVPNGTSSQYLMANGDTSTGPGLTVDSNGILSLG